MNDINFSIAILNDNQNNLLNCLNNIEKQNYDLNKVEVIIETLKLDDELKKQLNKLKVKCVIRENDELNAASCYNDALNIANGKYVSFINSSIIYDDYNTLSNVLSIQDTNIVVTNIAYFDPDMNAMKTYILSSKKQQYIDIRKESGKINLALESYFIKKELLNDLSFDNKFNNECKQKFIIDLYEKEKNYFNYGDMSIVSYEPFEDNSDKCSIQYDINWYNTSLNNWIEYVKNLKFVPIYLQEALMYIIYAKYNCNTSDKNKNVIKNGDLELFIENTTKLLSYINDTIILQKGVDSEFKKIGHRFKMPDALRMYYYNLKYKDNKKYYSPNGSIYNAVNEYRPAILSLANQKIHFRAINYNKGKLIFDCSINVTELLSESDFKIIVRYGENDVEVKKVDLYNCNRVFGKVCSNNYSFQFAINVNNNYHDLKIYLCYDNQEYRLSFVYDKIQSRLTDSTKAFWQYKNFVVVNRRDRLVICKSSKFKVFKVEVKFALSKLKESKLKAIKKLWLRFLYYVTKPFMNNKNILVTFDKLYKAGDNGEYVYQYGLKHGKNIYYIIKSDSPDYDRLVRQNKKHVLVHGSLRCKLYSLHAKAILKTHAGILGFLGFTNDDSAYIRGLLNADIIEIQHGLTIQDIPEYQNRIVDNNKLYMIASQKEYDNIIKKEYGYTDNQIKLVGLARYDGLVNNDQRQILITPTWRHNIASPSLRHGVPRSHNDNFKNSEYFKIYNALINDSRLIEAAKNYNYRIMYLIHPTLSSQIDDFDKNDYVDIVPATGDMSYEKVLTESSLMVTDYSGIQYDFAYMRKPILYFQPDELPPHYDNSLDYEKEGFGKIIKTTNSLVDELIDKMKNECKNDQEYIDRANKFFAFDDHNNCERIFNELDK